MREHRTLEIEQIWQNFLYGDHESFDLLYSKFIHPLYTYGLLFTSDRELIKDCIQDVFITIYDTRTELYHVNNASVYIRIVLKNRLINALKKEKRHLEYSRVSDFVPDEFTVEKSLESLEEEQYNRYRIETILTVLTPKQREIVRYRYIDGLDLEEISSLMGINYQSVQNILQRAIKKIKNIFLNKVSIK